MLSEFFVKERRDERRRALTFWIVLSLSAILFVVLMVLSIAGKLPNG